VGLRRSGEPAAAPARIRGVRLVGNSALNKGTAFSDEERTRLGLHGLLPPRVESLDEQVGRAYEAYREKRTDLGRHVYLRALQDTNEILFYRLLLDHIEEMTPIVYTPVVARACQRFSAIYRRPRGLFVSYPLRDRIPELLRNRPNREVDVIVVTDGERILGIGDQGVGGLGIPIGKLSLYVLIGGIHPARTLPIVLDAGTNNPELLRAPEYLGWRHERVTGVEYDGFVDRFVKAVRKELPGTCLQWEDFATPHARPILERYRDELLTFNDDIQGTAAVTLGVILSAVRVAGRGLKDEQIVFLGGGSAAIGVADSLREAMVAEGLAESEALARFFVVDKDGLFHTGRTDLTPEQRLYAQPAGRIPGGGIGLADVIGSVNATILIGLSTACGAFTEMIVREMARKTNRPIILPLSNPTERCEAQAEDLIAWTAGRAIVATGSPSAPVSWNGRTFPIAQCNNVYIFPAVGLGVVASRARRISDEMLLAAARALAETSPALTDPNAPLLPALRDFRTKVVEVALAVGLEAQRAGLAPETTPEALRERILASQWSPRYEME
jgi:malate dehydrogenase (oxaloacetate-decarboxylating)